MSGSTNSLQNGASIELSLQQLRHLIDRGAEAPDLDYKRMIDLTERRSAGVVELAKDIGAMQIKGGFIVIGVDDSGKLTPEGIPLDQVKLFDSATLHDKVKYWIPEPFEVQSQTYEIQGSSRALIYIPPRHDGFCVFKEDGVPKNSKPPDKPAFRKGDVYARHSSKSERWNQHDAQEAKKSLATQAKDEWRRGLGGDLEALGIGARGQTLAEGPTSALTWELDQETFASAVTELMRRDDDIPLRQFLMKGAGRSEKALVDGDLDALETITSRIVAVAALGLTHKRENWFRDAVGKLHRLYASAHGDSNSVQLWQIISSKMYALGALAVRIEDWEAVRLLSEYPAELTDGYYTSWLRHAGIQLARSSSKDSKSMLTTAAEATRADPALRPEVSPESGRILKSISQFDLLQSIAVIDRTKEVDPRGWYPYFVLVDGESATEAAERLVSDQAMRSVLFKGADTELADALVKIGQLGSNEARGVGAWWPGFDSELINNWILAHPPHA